MAKHPTQYHKLSKRDKKKHFSHELGGGKGDCPRKFNSKNNKTYNDNKFFENCEFEIRKRAKQSALSEIS